MRIQLIGLFVCELLRGKTERLRKRTQLGWTGCAFAAFDLAEEGGGDPDGAGHLA
jgi:hypothetical protein